MSRYAVGIDIGGTKISIVLGNDRGAITAKREIQTWTGKKAKACLPGLVSNLQWLLKNFRISKKNIRGIGVACPGAVNDRKGIVPRSPNLPGWKGIPLRRILKRVTGLPVTMANDANAAALGEYIFGAGKGSKNFIYVTVSTGVGGGLVIKGELYTGTSNVAGEIGHMSIVPDGLRCKCGKRGCLEAYASGTAIAHDVRRRSKRMKTNVFEFVPRGEKLSAREIGKAARGGDKLCIETYRSAGRYLGIGIANLLNLLNPDKIVLGGGVWRSAPQDFWRSMMKSARQHAWPEAFHAAKIVRSKLLGRSGDLGALALVFKNQCVCSSIG